MCTTLNESLDNVYFVVPLKNIEIRAAKGEPMTCFRAKNHLISMIHACNLSPQIYRSKQTHTTTRCNISFEEAKKKCWKTFSHLGVQHFSPHHWSLVIF